jgi:hypothetical protein
LHGLASDQQDTRLVRFIFAAVLPRPHEKERIPDTQLEGPESSLYIYTYFMIIGITIMKPWCFSSGSCNVVLFLPLYHKMIHFPSTS